MAFYGTKKWDITAVKSPRRNIVPPKKITDPSPECVTQDPDRGFDVTVTRIFKQGGTTVRTETFTTTTTPRTTSPARTPTPK